VFPPLRMSLFSAPPFFPPLGLREVDQRRRARHIRHGCLGLHVEKTPDHCLVSPSACSSRRYGSSNQVIVAGNGYPPVVPRYGLAILHKAPKIYGERVGTDEEQALQFCQGNTLNVELDDRSRSSPCVSHTVGPTCRLFKLGC